MILQEHSLRDGQEQFFDASKHVGEIPLLSSILLTNQEAGSFLLGKTLLGKGGFATVTKGLHINKDQFVAIKSSPSTQYGQELAKSEAKCLATIFDSCYRDTPELIAYIEASSEGRSKSNIIMPIIKEPTLAALILHAKESGCSLPIRTSVNIIKSISQVLTRTYKQHQIQHRDPTPKNIKVTSEGVIIMDWGIADTVYQTQPDEFVGNLLYVAPELFTTYSSYTPQSTVYALGVVFHEILTGEHTHGQLPIDEHGEIDKGRLVYRVAQSTPLPLNKYKSLTSTLNADLLSKLQLIQSKALAKEPGERYEDPQQYANALILLINQYPEIHEVIIPIKNDQF